MWKDFLYYSRSERQGIIILLVIIGAIAGIGEWMSHRTPNEPTEAQQRELAEFMARVEQNRTKEREQETEPPATLFQFDPNRIDSVGLIRLGLTPFATRNVLKYRARGGVFRRVEDFARIYGLSPEQFQQLRPYITVKRTSSTASYSTVPPATPASIGPDTVRHRQPVAHTTSPKHTAPFQRTAKLPEGSTLDLNLADTTALKRVPGIGSYYARRITDYRRQLGGYAHPHQVTEIKGLPENIERWFVVTTPPTPSLRINRWDVERLRRHPYLNFYQAKAIVEHRKKYGHIDQLSALTLYTEFTEEDLQRLRPYVRFD